MFNHTTVARAFVKAACALVFTALATGMGTTWADSDQSTVLEVSSVVRPGAPVLGPSTELKTRRLKLAFACPVGTPPNFYTCACPGNPGGAICIGVNAKCCCIRGVAQACP